MDFAQKRYLAIDSLCVGLVLKRKEDFFDGEKLAGVSATHLPNMAVGSTAEFGDDLEASLHFFLKKGKLRSFVLLRRTVS